MALNMPTIIEYLGGGDAMAEMDTAREEVMTFLTTSDEDTAALTAPAALTLTAAGSDADLRALLWVVACNTNDDTVPLGARVYVGDVASVPTLLVRRL